MILNKDNILYYGNDGPELRLQSSLFYIRDFDDANYWYVDFFHGHHLADVSKNIPTDTLSEIQAGNVTLLLNNSHEAFHDVVEYIYLYFVDGLNIPAPHITLLSESAIINEEVKVIASKYSLPEIKTEWVRIFEHNIQTATTSHEADAFKLKTYLKYRNYDKLYTKKFLNLNRRWRTHRPLFVALLKVNNLLEQGYVSMAPADDNQDWERAWENIIQHEPELIQYKNEVINMPALYLDTYDMHINQVALTNDTDQYYLDTYFSIVSETNFYQTHGSGLFLSEKVFKPVSKSHPFLVLGRPHTIKKFKEIGYQSFSDVIDESYDDEFDDRKRMSMVLAETRRLCNLSNEELKTFLASSKKTTAHNYKLLNNKKEFITLL
jgi:hypothetical protein